ncbi:alpha/beta hydrolase [Sphingobium naphthae]|nr:alpha/beta hydrolase [Sphingobium naphthae]
MTNKHTISSTSSSQAASGSASVNEVPTLTRRGALSLSAGAALLGTGVVTPVLASSPPATGSADEPLGIGLEGWTYPAPLSFLPLVMAGQPVRMAYMDVAPTAAPSGRAIFLLHGKNFDSSYWSDVIRWLAAAGYRVIVPDQIGFNKSTKPALAYTFEGLARNTMALADALYLQRIEVLGHSTGGALAVKLASLYPDRVERLVLEDPIGLVDYSEFIPPQETSTLVAAEEAYTAQTYRAFIGRFFPLLAPQNYEQFVTWRMRVRLSAEFDRFALASALTYQMIYKEPTRPLYASLPMPVLLTAGTQDRSAPLAGYAKAEDRARMPGIHEAGQAAVNELRSGRFISFPGVGHVPHLEAPDRFHTEVLGFLKS